MDRRDANSTRSRQVRLNRFSSSPTDTTRHLLAFSPLLKPSLDLDLVVSTAHENLDHDLPSAITMTDNIWIASSNGDLARVQASLPFNASVQGAIDEQLAGPRREPWHLTEREGREHVYAATCCCLMGTRRNAEISRGQGRRRQRDRLGWRVRGAH